MRILAFSDLHRDKAAARSIVAASAEAALSVACGAGLRVSEVRYLRDSDVDAKRMVLRIEQLNRT